MVSIHSIFTLNVSFWKMVLYCTYVWRPSSQPMKTVLSSGVFHDGDILANQLYNNLIWFLRVFFDDWVSCNLLYLYFPKTLPHCPGLLCCDWLMLLHCDWLEIVGQFRSRLWRERERKKELSLFVKPLKHLTEWKAITLYVYLTSLY